MAGISIDETRAYQNSIYISTSMTVGSTAVRYRVAFYINGNYSSVSSEKTGSTSYSNITKTYYSLSAGTTYTITVYLQYYNTVDQSWQNSGYSASKNVTTTSPTTYYLNATYHQGIYWESTQYWSGTLASRTSGAYSEAEATTNYYKELHRPPGYEFDHYDTSTSGVYRFVDFYYDIIPTYTLSYYANGGSTTPASVSGIQSGQSVTLSSKINRDSGTGSYISGSRTVSFDAHGGTAPSNKTANITTYYRRDYSFNKWVDSYYGNSYSAGGSYTMPSSNVQMTATWAYVDVTTGQSTAAITLPSTSKTVGVFGGWYTAASGGTRVGGAGDSYTPSSNITLHAHWQYTLSYNANGGTTTPASVGNKENGTQITLAAAIAHNPETWDASGGNVTVSYDGNGATDPSSQTAAVTQHWKKTYAFSVWQDTYDSATYAAGYQNYVMPARNPTMKAIWSTSTTQTGVTIASVTLPSITRSGHTFNGWYTSASGGTRVGGAGGIYTPSTNVTLHAQWTINSYTISVNSDPLSGGSVSGGNTYTYGSTCTVSANPNSGYRFNGWYEGSTLASSSTSYQFSVTAQRTLVAKFVKTYILTVQYQDAITGDSIHNDITSAIDSGTIVDLNSSIYKITITGYTYSTGAESVKIDRDITKILYYSHDEYMITTSILPVTAGTVTGGGIKYYGDTCILTVSYDSTKHTFDGWYENGSKIGSQTTYQFIVSSNRTIQAKMTYIPIGYFYWTNDDALNIDVNKPVSNLAATRWNTIFKPKVALVMSRQSKGTSSIPDVTSGSAVGATLYNLAKTDIARLDGSGTLPDNVQLGTPLRKGHFNGTMTENGISKRSLKEALNKAIDYTNSQG